jgi:hypothetical protein
MWLGGGERSELKPSHMRNSPEKVGSSRSPIRFYGNFNKEKNKLDHSEVVEDDFRMKCDYKLVIGFCILNLLTAT